MDFLIKHKLINPSQHGFLKAKSCLTNLLCFLEEITKWVDDGSPVSGVARGGQGGHGPPKLLVNVFFLQ